MLLLDKPTGMSSNAALQKARWLFNAEKAGHTGTLDPLATGLLPLCFGEATKFAGQLLDAGKSYLATVRLGIVTDTADADGVVLGTHPVAVTREDVLAVLPRFTGEIDQVPPMHSALKRDGVPLYELARKGIEVARVARRVMIRALRLRNWRDDGFEIEVDCSKGSYVRTLAADIGAVLGCGAHLAALRRTRVGTLDLAAAMTLEWIEAMPSAARDGLLLPADSLLAELPVIQVGAREAVRLLHGQPVRWNHGASCRPGQPELPSRHSRLYGPDGFIGLGECVEDGWLKPKRLVATS